MAPKLLLAVLNWATTARDERGALLLESNTLHLPLVDLCALGGWKDAQTILKCYQRSDEGTMRRALEERSVQRGVLGS